MSNAALPLEGKTALVTGGARRVGAEIVSHLHAAGARVAIHCHRSRAEGEALAEALNTVRAESAVVFCADLLRSATIPALIDSVGQRLGGIDVLVNNASAFYPTPWGELNESQWNELMGSNLKAPLLLAQAASGALRRARGLIVNIADIHG